MKKEIENLKIMISSKESEGSGSLKLIESENEKLIIENKKLKIDLDNQINLVITKDTEKDAQIQNIKKIHLDEMETIKKQMEEFEKKLKIGELSLESSKKEFEDGLKKKEEIIENLQKLISAAELELKNFKIVEENLKIAALADFENKIKQNNEENKK